MRVVDINFVYIFFHTIVNNKFLKLHNARLFIQLKELLNSCFYLFTIKFNPEKTQLSFFYNAIISYKYHF